MENSIDIFLIIVLVLIIPIANAIFLYSKYKQYKEILIIIASVALILKI